ncbi:MAG: DUF1080 domain-containing protein [Planctomycetota bacterium]
MFPQTLHSRWSFLLTSFAACFVATSAIGAGPSEDSSKTQPLFDGKSLDGWNGDPKWFQVRDGVIVAGSLKERIPQNQFLCTNESFADFELTVEAKLVGEGDNAGVQFRTRRIPDDTEVIGYQADIGFVKDGTCWGALYDESRRRKFLAQSPDIAMKALKRGQWNQLRILAKGDRIQIFLNGVRTVDYTEEDGKIERDGVVALQVHSGPPLEVHYRNVMIRRIK